MIICQLPNFRRIGRNDIILPYLLGFKFTINKKCLVVKIKIVSANFIILWTMYLHQSSAKCKCIGTYINLSSDCQ